MHTNENTEYDFVIIGSGLGGLVSAFILADEGYKVIVLEKNHQIGGLLQVYSRDKTIFDTGVHYVGGLNEGENLNQFFKYLGIFDQLKLKKLDEDRFDVIRFSDGTQFNYAQGNTAFKNELIRQFPDDSQAIELYCAKITEVCLKFPLYNLEVNNDGYLNDNSFMRVNAFDYIASITDNKKLQNVLAGSNLLYAGVKEKTPFYIHALILNSYLSGSYKLINGGSQIAILLSRQIRARGGKIVKHKEVVSANYNAAGEITEVLLKNGEAVRGKQFISNIHPIQTIDIFGENRFLKMYKNRITNLENTISSFLVHLTFHKNTFEYLNYNIYQHHVEDVWAEINYDPKNWPQSYFICTPYSSKNEVFTDSMSIMTYMRAQEVDAWSESHNTVSSPGSRQEAYTQFKKEKEKQVIQKLLEVFPDIESKIKSVHSATPLTFRDYIGNPDGSLYGILKDSSAIEKTQINTKTRIPNLHLTGQNISMHGILGVTISAFITSFSFIDKQKLIQKVKSA